MTYLSNFNRGFSAAVFGATGGIGRALIEALCIDPNVGSVFALSRRKPDTIDRRIQWVPFDLESEETIRKASDCLKTLAGSLNLAMVATGVLHDNQDIRPEKNIKSLSGEAMDHIFRINATGPALIAKYCAPLLSKNEKSILAFLSARVGSISDNELGGWYSYRASKAALHMVVKTLSIELSRTHPKAICVAMHPGTVHTPLSRPFVAEKARNAVEPSEAALNITKVINGLELDHTGRIWDWQGKEIEP